jgi:hypothetical protein
MGDEFLPNEYHYKMGFFCKGSFLLNKNIFYPVKKILLSIFLDNNKISLYLCLVQTI